MGLVNRIKGTPFHGDKILTTMLRRAPLAFMYRVNFHASGLSPFESVHERNSNAHTFCLIMHQVSFPFERVSKRPTNVSILFHFRSNTFTNALRTRAFCFSFVRTLLRTLHERERTELIMKSMFILLVASFALVMIYASVLWRRVNIISRGISDGNPDVNSIADSEWTVVRFVLGIQRQVPLKMHISRSIQTCIQSML